MEERKAALMLMLCSTLVGFTGNFFLSFIGCMCGAMHYFNNGSAPDLMFMLSFLTSVLGMVYLFSVLSFGTLLFFVSPERVCSVSASLLDKFTGERAALPEGAGYPWNSTELEMHGDHINTYGHHYPKTAKGITQGAQRARSIPLQLLHSRKLSFQCSFDTCTCPPPPFLLLPASLFLSSPLPPPPHSSPPPSPPALGSQPARLR